MWGIGLGFGEGEGRAGGGGNLYGGMRGAEEPVERGGGLPLACYC